MGLLNIDENSLQHWDVILNFLKKYIPKKVGALYYPLDIENFNYRIYPNMASKINNLYVYYAINIDRREVEIYFDKSSQNRLYLVKNNKRLYPIRHYRDNSYEPIKYKHLIEMIYESAE